MKTIPKKKKFKRQVAVWEGLTNSCEKKRSETQKTKGKVHTSKCRVPKNSKEREDSHPKSTMQREENNRMGKTRDLVKKIRDTKGTFHAKMGSIKDRNDTNKSRRY